MVAAHEHPRLTFPLHEADSSVAAGIRERANHTILSACNENGDFREVDRKETPRGRQLPFMTNEVPTLHEQPLYLQLVESGIMVGLRRQRAGLGQWLAPGQTTQGQTG